MHNVITFCELHLESLLCALPLIGKIAHYAFGDDEMFRSILVESARMLGLIAGTMGMLSVHMKTMKVGVNTRFGRRWESNIREREFDRQLVERRAFNEIGSRLPLAR